RPSPNAPPSRCSMPGSTPTPGTYLQTCSTPTGSAGAISFQNRSTLVRVCTLFQVPSNSAMSRRGMARSPFVGREERSESRHLVAFGMRGGIRFATPALLPSRAPPLRFGLIRAREFKLAQVFGVDAGHVVAREARVVEVLQVLVAFRNRVDEIVEVLVNQPVGADGFADV